jgi:hypothetical protein
MGGKAVDQAKGDRAVGGVIKGALPLHEEPVAARLTLLAQPLARPLHKIAHHPIDRNPPALDHDPRLAGGYEHAREPGPMGRGAQLQGHAHLADGAVGADGEDDPRARPVQPALRGLHPLRRFPVVDQLHAHAGRLGCELGVLRHEGVEAAQHIQAGIDRPQDDRSPGPRKPPTGRSDSDQERGRPQRQRLFEGRHHRHVVGRAKELAGIVAGPCRVDHRDHRVRAVADHAECGLCRMKPELALSEDHEATCSPGHATSATGAGEAGTSLRPSVAGRPAATMVGPSAAILSRARQGEAGRAGWRTGGAGRGLARAMSWR